MVGNTFANAGRPRVLQLRFRQTSPGRGRRAVAVRVRALLMCCREGLAHTLDDTLLYVERDRAAVPLHGLGGVSADRADHRRREFSECPAHSSATRLPTMRSVSPSSHAGDASAQGQVVAVERQIQLQGAQRLEAVATPAPRHRRTTARARRTIDVSHQRTQACAVPGVAIADGALSSVFHRAQSPRRGATRGVSLLS